jgi:hypothetical protein
MNIFRDGDLGVISYDKPPSRQLRSPNWLRVALWPAQSGKMRCSRSARFFSFRDSGGSRVSGAATRVIYCIRWASITHPTSSVVKEMELCTRVPKFHMPALMFHSRQIMTSGAQEWYGWTGCMPDLPWPNLIETSESASYEVIGQAGNSRSRQAQLDSQRRQWCAQVLGL